MNHRPWLAHYEAAVPADVAGPDRPVAQNLVTAAETRPDGTALICGNVVGPLGNLLMGAKASCATLLESTYRFAASLQELGIQEGDRVRVHLPNCPQFPIAYTAALMTGAIAVLATPLTCLANCCTSGAIPAPRRS